MPTFKLIATRLSGQGQDGASGAKGPEFWVPNVDMCAPFACRSLAPFTHNTNCSCSCVSLEGKKKRRRNGIESNREKNAKDTIGWAAS